jgi:hypothetical protein
MTISRHSARVAGHLAAPSAWPEGLLFLFVVVAAVAAAAAVAAV